MGVSRSPARPASGSPAYSPDDLPIYRGGSTSAEPTIELLYDSFTEASVTSIVDHTPDTVVSPAATPWAQNGTFFQVGVSGVLEVVGSGNNRQCYINGGADDGIASTDIVKLGVGLMFRHADTNNYWMAFNRASGATTVELYEITGGTLTTRGTYNVGSYADRKIQALCSGASIDIYIDGTLRISHTSSAHQTATGVGFRAENGAGGTGNPAGDTLRTIASTDPADLP